MTVRASFLTSWVLLVAALCLAEPAAGGEEGLTRWPLKEEDIPKSQVDWYRVTISGTHVGWMRTSLERVGPPEPGGAAVVRALEEIRLDVTCGDVTAWTTRSTLLDFDASPPYRLRSARRDEDAEGVNLLAVVARLDGGQAGPRTWSSLTREGSAWKGTRSGPSGTEDLAIATFDYTLGDLLASPCWCRGERRVGEHLRHRAIDWAALAVGEAAMTVGDVGSAWTHDGLRRWLHADVRSSDGTTGHVRFDPVGNRALALWQGMQCAEWSTEDLAKAMSRPPDLLDTLAWAKIDSCIAEPDGLDRLVLQADGRGSDLIRSGPRQAVSRDPRTRRVRIVLGDPVAASPRATPEEIADALRISERYGAGDEEIARLSAEVVKGAPDAHEKVSRLVAHVKSSMHYEIREGEPPVGTTLRDRRGDCSEHALLLVALARAAGIPAREVLGLAYLGLNALAYHAWCEVVLDGEWVAVDPTEGEAPCDIVRVATGWGEPDGSPILPKGTVTFRVLEQHRAR